MSQKYMMVHVYDRHGDLADLSVCIGMDASIQWLRDYVKHHWDNEMDQPLHEPITHHDMERYFDYTGEWYSILPISGDIVTEATSD